MVEIAVIDDDRSLIENINRHDAAAMEAFYKRHASSVYRFAYRRLNDAALADEVVNDTLHQVWLSAGSYGGQSSPKTWLLGIAKNKILDALRSKGRLEARTEETSEEDQQRFADTAPGAYAILLGKQQGHHLSQCFDELPDEQRVCMHLSFVEGLSLAEIAEIMTVPANTVATRIHHAKRKLRTCMECIFGKGEIL